MAGHSAAASAAGYLYQTNWALVDLLRKDQHRPDQAIILEMHDDVAWTRLNGLVDPVELLQVKLHANGGGGSLGDIAVDIWTTFKVWMDRSDYRPAGPRAGARNDLRGHQGTAAIRTAACRHQCWPGDVALADRQPHWRPSSQRTVTPRLQSRHSWRSAHR